jgi:hypothetical protein
LEPSSSNLDISIPELSRSPELRVGLHQALLVLVWRGRITEATLTALNDVEAAVVAKVPRIRVINAVVGTASGEASISMMQAAAKLAARFDASVIGSATVVLGGTRVATATRMVLDGLLVLIGQADRYRFFSRLPDALTWLGKLPPQGAERVGPELAAAVEAFIRESAG